MTHMYQHDGYLVIPELLDAEALALARKESVALCRGERGAIEGVTAAGSEDDATVLRRHLCVHFPHKISPVLCDLAVLPAAIAALTEVIGPNVKLMQSMLFIKSGGRPGQAWHQDEAHIPTRDRSLTAIWIALDDATVDNGCLWVLPGSHRRGILYPERPQTDPRFDCTREAHGFPDEAAVPVELPAGTAVLFNGYLLHRSLPNTVPGGTRRALVNHYMSAESLLPWFPPDPEVPMAGCDHRDILLVAGEDPYAYKGTTDLMRPHVRADGKGGCVR